VPCNLARAASAKPDGQRPIGVDLGFLIRMTDWLKHSEVEAQLTAKPKLMARPVIHDGDVYYLGWDQAVQKALLPQRSDAQYCCEGCRKRAARVRRQLCSLINK
jgi:hypothetical protein